MEGVIKVSKGASGKWVASSDMRPNYIYSACKPCVIRVMLSMTKNSKTYHTIEVHNEDGTVEIIPTGSNSQKNGEGNGETDGRTSQENS